jgi:polyhydroxybutyrate depolymerase
MNRNPGTNKFILSGLVILCLMLVLIGLSCNHTATINQTPIAASRSSSSKTTNYDYTESMTSGGIKRTYTVHVGLPYDRRNPTPLVIALHGHGGTGQGMATLTAFNPLADKEDFVVVYPDGINGGWNDGRLVEQLGQGQNVDDVGFISDLIDNLSKELNIDSKKVFVTGMSNGAIMAHRLGCELSSRIAAIAPVAGNISVIMAPKWNPSRGMPALIINVTEDPLVPWAGGQVHFGQISRGEVLSVADTVKFWVTKDQCSASPQIIQLPGNGSQDGTSVRTETYSGGRDNSEVVLYAVEGGGHTWPGGIQYLPQALIGKTSKQFNATDVIWQFFKEHPEK